MKKILFSAYSLEVGGIETALVTLLKNINNKYEITLVLEKNEGIFTKDIPENIKIITYKPNNNKNKLVRKMNNFIKQQMFKIKYKNKFDYSVCYATYSFPASFCARVASQNNILWVHNDYMNFYENNIMKYKEFFNKLKVNEYKKIIFVSENDRKIFLGQFKDLSEKCKVCNNLVDYQKIINLSKEEVSDYDFKENTITFINLGRHDEKQKKLNRIIEATKRLNNEGYIFKVIFVGNGQDTEDIMKKAEGVNNIEFLGSKKNPYPYLKNSDCLILSSDFEGYPVVFLESMILEKPIIATDVSDSKEAIDKKYGIVVPKTIEGIYNGMKDFLDHGFSVQKFDPKVYNDKILNNLEEIFK